jgi:hypothetical protein
MSQIDTAEIRFLRQSALACLDDSDQQIGLRGAAWRVADAGLLIRGALPYDASGVALDCTTGRGALLPAPQKADYIMIFR